VEAGLHDLDCVVGHHTEGVLHGFPNRIPDRDERGERLGLFEQQQCNYEQSFDQAFPHTCPVATAAAASANSAGLGRCTPRSTANQIVNVKG
jgi:hypothetical protein